MSYKTLISTFEKCGVSLSKIDSNSSIIFLGTLFSFDNEELVERVLKSKEDFIYCSPMEDSALQEKAKSYIKYEVTSEAGVLALLSKELLKDEEKTEETKEFLDELDDGYLSAESNVGEEEICEIVEFIKSSKKCTLVLGADLYNHPDLKSIAEVISILVTVRNLRVSIIDDIEHEAKKIDIKPEDIEELKSFDGLVVYFVTCKNTNKAEKLFGPKQFLQAAKIKDKEVVDIYVEGKKVSTKEFNFQSELKGTIAISNTAKDIEGYRYKKVKILPKDTKQ
ncbi:MAG: hypothetical protein ACK5LP_05650 [Campylobacteraceae bacterium]